MTESQTDNFFQKNWIYFAAIGGGVAAILLLVVILALGYYCCCYRKRRRSYIHIPNDYVEANGVTESPTIGTVPDAPSTNGDVRGEVGLLEGLRQRSAALENSKRESALLNCQYYLRGNKDFFLDTHLPDIGSRMSKRWFLVRPAGRVQQTVAPNLLTMLPVSQQCKIKWDSRDKVVLNELLCTLSHPYLHSFQQVDMIKEKSLVVVVESFIPKGSLKDLIYQTTPTLDWATKYSVRKSGLRVAQIQNFGRQILEAVAFLYSLGFKSVGQIQSGNVYLDKNRCKLSGFENSLLGYRPRVYQLVKKYKNVDSAMFAHLLYELGSGRELTVASPSAEDMRNIRYTQVGEVVEFILQSDRMPDLAEVLQLPFFQQGVAQELRHWDREDVTISDEARELIHVVYSGKRRPQPGPTKRKKSRSKPEPAYPVYGSPSLKAESLSTTGVQHSSNVSFAKSAESTAAERSPARERATAPAPKTSKRSALLGAIRRGAKLRPTVTDDRSAPIIK